VGGILANDTYPVDFLSQNLRIQVNVLDAALDAGVERLLFLGSSCIYPRMAEQPIREEYLIVQGGHLAGVGAHSYSEGDATGGSEEAARYKAS